MISQSVPEGYHFTFKEHLFNQEEHRFSQTTEGWESFYWLDETNQQVLISWHVYIHQNEALSPFRATFGGPDFDRNVSLKNLTAFISEVNKLLRKKAVNQLDVILAPQGYHLEIFSKTFQAFSENGFEVNYSKIHSFIDISDDDYQSMVHRSAKTKLNHGLKMNFTVQHGDIRNLQEVYRVLAQNRAEKGRELSMSHRALEALIKQLPYAFLLTSLKHEGKVIAASISIRVTHEVLYVFYFGHLAEYNANSPVVSLMKGLYDYCQKERISILDLGTSATDNGTDHNLLDFKRSLGATSGLKVSLKKRYA